ncbi:SDR family NAD(P)-dependent oxidoreductase [Gordonia sp. N1V]|uniref:SDR family NAD(P)-dependent oxidoreductase n=1 Tax=Gordonia sp. N1V TaxID=3034163 RepID=UPI0023E0A43B|nr:SDR family NAD(P)-dependent oxidoreductase [Gordonia sp. N1V]MDF3281686.1 SDR family NAD(P)-dependent oxidoreductase [Gordonia sp. N1V]
MTTGALTHESVLVIGASRGLGEAIVEEYTTRGAHVMGTARGAAPTLLHDFARRSDGQVEIEHVDIDDPTQLAALAERLAGRVFDLLFVVAGISLAPMNEIAADIADKDFGRMMQTNVLSVMRTVERLQHLVHPTGTIAVMSSGQGSVTNNTSGGFEVYRATKSALNQMMRSHAARHADERRALLLMAPGWVRTDLGGPKAALEVSEAIPPLIDTVEAQRGIPGLRYLDRHGDAVPW